MLLRGMAAARHGLAAWSKQLAPCLAVAARRLVASSALHGGSSAPADELNREMAEFFGAGAGTEQQQQGGSGSPSAASTPGDGRQVPAALQPEVHAFNTELLELLGTQQQQQQGGGESSMSSATTSAAATAGPAGAFHVAAAAADSGSYSSSRSNESSSSRSGSGDAGGDGAGLTHVDACGRAAMVDVSQKANTVRSATAAARVVLGPEVFRLVATNQLSKGDVLTVAQLAGVLGAKHTATLIPLCHTLLLSKVDVALALDAPGGAVLVTATARTVGPTGVEMEALTAAAVAALCVYDMCKAASKAIVVTDLRLLSKSGGKSGEWRAAAAGG